MKDPWQSAIPILALLAALWAPACSPSTPQVECERDEDCPIGRYCLLATWTCRYDCTFSRECPTGYECSTRGKCQPEQCQPTHGGVEDCDGLDNDCDGQTDEDLAPRACSASNEHGVCEGTETCLGGRWVCDARSARAEECNGLDDDCDGQTDEGFFLGEACDGVGECGAGVLECAGLEATRCSTDPGGSQDESRPEACNGLDDDCDGQTDEGAPVLDSCELGAEAADGLDNNCDGIIDPPGGCVRRHPFVAVYVDTYEAAVFENPDCTGRQYGIYSDDYPADWPDGAQAGTRSLYACSLPGLRPSRSVTWYQARRACLAQGKRLCTKQEWAQACGGSIYSKFPYGNVFNAFFCNTFSAGHLDTVAAGSMPNCRAEFGMFDMSGNLWEWVESVCQNDSAMKAIQGGSYYCWVYVSGQGWMPCDMDDPAHTQEIAWQHACQYPPHDRFYCELPLTAQVNFGFRCCLDAP